MASASGFARLSLQQDAKPAGSIELILGPMFSGKSTELIRRLRRYQAAARKVLLVRYKLDTRYSQDSVVTHDRTKIKAVPATALQQVENSAWNHEVIAIDEGQFMPDIVEYAEKWANAGKIVVIAALDGTFQRQPFNSILQLVPLAEDVCKLKAVCSGCRREAAFTRRLGDETDIEVVGGAEKYTATCRACHSLPQTPATLPNSSISYALPLWTLTCKTIAFAS